MTSQGCCAAIGWIDFYLLMIMILMMNCQSLEKVFNLFKNNEFSANPCQCHLFSGTCACRVIWSCLARHNRILPVGSVQLLHAASARLKQIQTMQWPACATDTGGLVRRAPRQWMHCTSSRVAGPTGLYSFSVAHRTHRVGLLNIWIFYSNVNNVDTTPRFVTSQWLLVCGTETSMLIGPAKLC